MSPPSGEPPWLDLACRLSTACKLGERHSEIVPTEEACLRVVAQDVHAPEPVPRVPYALRNGYAVRAAETNGATAAAPIALQISRGMATYFANGGDPAMRAMRQGECVSVPAGIPLPQNADAVVPYLEEQTDELNPPPVFEERITAPVRSGANVQECGEDYKQGAALITRGTRITAQLQAVLIAAGVLIVPVYKRPRIGVALSSFDTVPPADAIHPWQRRDATSAYIRSALARWGHTVPPTEQVAPIDAPPSPSARRDAHGVYVQRLQDLMSRYDLLIGVGMPADSSLRNRGLGGPFAFPTPRQLIHFGTWAHKAFALSISDDRTPPVLGKRAIYRAGSTTGVAGWEGFAFYDRAIVLNLPGYIPEVAAYIQIAVRYIVDLMEGMKEPGPIWRQAALTHPLTRDQNVHRFLWANAHIDETGRVSIRANDNQTDLHLNAFSTSNALVALRSGTGKATAGERVDYILIE